MPKRLKTTLNEQPPSGDNLHTLIYYGWIIVTACVIIGIVSYGIRFSFGVFFKSIEVDFGLNRAATSGVQSLFLLLGCLIAPLGGLALDRFGPKKVFFLAGMVTAAALILTSRVTAFWQLYLSYSLLAAVGTSALNSMITATAARWFTRQRGLAVGIATSSGSLGMMAAPLIALLIAKYGWQSAYLILGVVAVLIWLPSALLLRRKPADPLPAEIAGANKADYLRESVSLKQALRYKPFWILFFSWMLQSFCMFLVVTHIVPYATDMGIDASRAAAIISVIGVGTLAGRLIMGQLADVRSKRQIEVISLVLWGVGIILLIWASNLWLLYFCAAVIGFGMGGSGPAMVSIFGDIFGLRHLGSILGGLDTSFGLGAAMGPALAGFIFDASHSYVIAFLIGTVAMAASIGLFLLVKIAGTKKAAG